MHETAVMFDEIVLAHRPNKSIFSRTKRMKKQFIWTLRRFASEIPMFFFKENQRFSVIKGRYRYNFKTAKGRNLKSRTLMGNA